MSVSLDPDVIDTLLKFNACDVSDALIKLGVAKGGFLPDLRPFVYPSHDSDGQVITIAPANTVLFAPKHGKSTKAYPPTNLEPGDEWADFTNDGSFLVISQPEGQTCSVMGGINATRVRELGAEGVIVQGRIRDIRQLKDTGLMPHEQQSLTPAFLLPTDLAKGTSTVKASAEAVAHAVDVPVEISGFTIHPGDIVFSDSENGVIVIPQDKLEDVLDLLPGIVEEDQSILDAVQDGTSVQDAVKEFRI